MESALNTVAQIRLSPSKSWLMAPLEARQTFQAAFFPTTWPHGKVAPDDVLDALAAALTAYLGHGKFRTLPSEPETDETGLRMEMVYFTPP